MIDLKELRKDPEAFRARLRGKRYSVPDFDRLVALDGEYRELLTEVERLRGERNETTKAIQGATPATRPALVEKGKGLKVELASKEARLAEVEPERDRLWLLVPNPPHESAATGGGEEANRVERNVGTPGEFPGGAKDHLDLAVPHGWIDLERGAKVAGSRFGYLHGALVHLELALVTWATRRLEEKGFKATIPPVLVRESAMRGTGFFPAEAFEIYKVEGEDHYLVGTAEVPLAGLHMEEILAADRLPLRYSGFSTCFRKEAGAAGKDTRGIFRVHQFDKLEMFSFTEPDKSWEEHELLLSIEEGIMASLGIPYRVVNVCDGDLGAPAAKKYDLEGWFPGQGRYRELTSCSNCTDFQARRLQARCQTEGEKPRLVHTLNGTAVAVGRTLIAILENHQAEDGSISVPEVLRPFMPAGMHRLGGSKA